MLLLWTRTGSHRLTVICHGCPYRIITLKEKWLFELPSVEAFHFAPTGAISRSSFNVPHETIEFLLDAHSNYMPILYCCDACQKSAKFLYLTCKLLRRSSSFLADPRQIWWRYRGMINEQHFLRFAIFVSLVNGA